MVNPYGVADHSWGKKKKKERSGSQNFSTRDHSIPSPDLNVLILRTAGSAEAFAVHHSLQPGYLRCSEAPARPHAHPCPSAASHAKAEHVHSPPHPQNQDAEGRRQPPLDKTIGPQHVTARHVAVRKLRSLLRPGAQAPGRRGRPVGGSLRVTQRGSRQHHPRPGAFSQPERPRRAPLLRHGRSTRRRRRQPPQRARSPPARGSASGFTP